ncbi:MAG: hypothetical protein IKH28_14640 [Lachnospiraceae bacterium]|nr:hypothetical protein [Lachnospiraceae bacterium]
MWADINTKEGKSVKILNNERIELKEFRPGKAVAYVGALLGTLLCLVVKPDRIIMVIIIACFVYGLGWLAGVIATILGLKKRAENENKKRLVDAFFYSETSIRQADETKLKLELGSSYDVNKTDEGWIIKYKSIQYNVVDLGDDSFSIGVNDIAKVRADVMEKAYGKIAYSLQKLCNAQEQNAVKLRKKEPSVKDHFILVAKLLIIFLVVGTLVFQGGHAKELRMGKYVMETEDFKGYGEIYYEKIYYGLSNRKGVKPNFLTTDEFYFVNFYGGNINRGNVHDSYTNLYHSITGIIMKREDININKIDFSKSDKDEFMKADYVIFEKDSDLPLYYIHDLGDGRIQFFLAFTDQQEYFDRHVPLGLGCYDWDYSTTIWNWVSELDE